MYLNFFAATVEPTSATWIPNTGWCSLSLSLCPRVHAQMPISTSMVRTGLRKMPGGFWLRRTNWKRKKHPFGMSCWLCERKSVSSGRPWRMAQVHPCWQKEFPFPPILSLPCSLTQLPPPTPASPQDISNQTWGCVCHLQHTLWIDNECAWPLLKHLEPAPYLGYPTKQKKQSIISKDRL